MAALANLGEKRKLYTTVGCQLINIEEMMELENHPWMLKLVGKWVTRDGIFT